MFRKKLKYMCYTIFYLSKILKKNVPLFRFRNSQEKMSVKHFFLISLLYPSQRDVHFDSFGKINLPLINTCLAMNKSVHIYFLLSIHLYTHSTYAGIFRRGAKRIFVTVRLCIKRLKCFRPSR